MTASGTLNVAVNQFLVRSAHVGAHVHTLVGVQLVLDDFGRVAAARVVGRVLGPLDEVLTAVPVGVGVGLSFAQRVGVGVDRTRRTSVELGVLARLRVGTEWNGAVRVRVHHEANALVISRRVHVTGGNRCGAAHQEGCAAADQRGQQMECVHHSRGRVQLVYQGHVWLVLYVCVCV